MAGDDPLVEGLPGIVEPQLVDPLSENTVGELLATPLRVRLELLMGIVEPADDERRGVNFPHPLPEINIVMEGLDHRRFHLPDSTEYFWLYPVNMESKLIH